MAKLFDNPVTNTEVLNPAALEVLTIIARQALDTEEGHATIDNSDGAYMPVHVEILDTYQGNGFARHFISVAHYGEVNGDLLADPDMTFILHLPDEENAAGAFAIPVEFQNDYAGVYQKATKHDATYMPTAVRAALVHDLVDFCDLWFNNIRQQQEIPTTQPAPAEN